ncbi:MAG: hypothetical protein CUN55_14800 [Phototrophicales bacterium]|nr:MAG: hypothetical protein CUN55_14800 [Phototrophicales bacterium]
MTAHHPNVLYIGNYSRMNKIKEVVEAYDWCILAPTIVEEALAFKVFYMPDIVVIDGVVDHNFSLTYSPCLKAGDSCHPQRSRAKHVLHHLRQG